jgi:hypothetical protein
MNVDIPIPPTTTVKEEFVLTMEVETSDELSRFWQSTTVPMRLSVVYKASVLFITPPAPARPTPRKPSRVTLAVDPVALPFDTAGRLIGTIRTVTFTDPESTAAKPVTVTYDLSPATAAPGQAFTVAGDSLDQTPRMFLLPPGSAEVDVSGWIPAAPAATVSRVVLRLPATSGGALPGDAPLPGVYQLRAGSAGAYRTNTVPLTVAPLVNVTVAPPAPPILAPVGGVFPIDGAGFVAGSTEVLLDTIPLQPTAGAPGAGQFQVVSSTSLQFVPPAGLATGRYTVRVRVNGVESDPSWWVNL